MVKTKRRFSFCSQLSLTFGCHKTCRHKNMKSGGAVRLAKTLALNFTLGHFCVCLARAAAQLLRCHSRREIPCCVALSWRPSACSPPRAPCPHRRHPASHLQRHPRRRPKRRTARSLWKTRRPAITGPTSFATTSPGMSNRRSRIRSLTCRLQKSDPDRAARQPQFRLSDLRSFMECDQQQRHLAIHAQ